MHLHNLISQSTCMQSVYTCTCIYTQYPQQPEVKPHPPWYGGPEVAVAEAPHHAIEQQMFPHSQQVKQDVVLRTETQRMTNLVHVGADVVAVHTSCPCGGFVESCEDRPEEEGGRGERGRREREDRGLKGEEGREEEGEQGGDLRRGEVREEERKG